MSKIVFNQFPKRYKCGMCKQIVDVKPMLVEYWASVDG